MTSFWVYRSPAFNQSSLPTSTSELTPGRYHNQVRIGVTRVNAVRPEGLTIVEDAKYTVSALDDTMVSREITELLQFALDLPNNFSSLAPWSSALLRQTIDMWCNGDLAISVASRQSFHAKGLQDSWSISDYDNNCLNITAGFLDETELESYREVHTQALSYLFVYSCHKFSFFLTSIVSLKSSFIMWQSPSKAAHIKRLFFQSISFTKPTSPRNVSNTR